MSPAQHPRLSATMHCHSASRGGQCRQSRFRGMTGRPSPPYSTGGSSRELGCCSQNRIYLLAFVLLISSVSAAATQPALNSTAASSSQSYGIPASVLQGIAASRNSSTNRTAADAWFNSPRSKSPQFNQVFFVLRVVQLDDLPHLETEFATALLVADSALLVAGIVINYAFFLPAFSDSGASVPSALKSFAGCDMYFSTTLPQGGVLNFTSYTVALRAAQSFNYALHSGGINATVLLVNMNLLPRVRLTTRNVTRIQFDSRVQITGVGLYPMIIEKRTMLMQQLFEAFIRKKLPIVTVNVTEVVSAAPGSGSVHRLGSDPPGNSSVSSAARDTLVVIITTEMYNYQFSDGPPTTPLTPTALWKAVSETSLNSSTALSRAIDVELTYLNATIIYHKSAFATNTTAYAYDSPLHPATSNNSSSATTRQDSGLPIGGILGIVGGALVLCGMVAASIFYRGRRRRPGVEDGRLEQYTGLWSTQASGTPQTSGSSQPPASSFKSSVTQKDIDPSEIEICKRDDGSDWQLGSGSFGTVFKGLRHGFQEVAVKKLTPSTAEDMWFRLLSKEIDVLKKVSVDRNVVQFYGACLQSQASAMLIMEYMEGGDLRRALLRDGAKWQWKCHGPRVAMDIARGLQFLHASEVIHRDIKSSNILLTAEGVAKIADVGLAKVLTSVDQSFAEHQVAGTFSYVAPEVLLGSRSTSTKADAYSFGVVLWEIVTGEMPRRGSLREVQVPEECPQEISDLIDRCLLAEPERRPSMGEVCSLIQSLRSSGSDDDVTAEAGGAPLFRRSSPGAGISIGNNTRAAGFGHSNKIDTTAGSLVTPSGLESRTGDAERSPKLQPRPLGHLALPNPFRAPV